MHKNIENTDEITLMDIFGALNGFDDLRFAQAWSLLNRYKRSDKPVDEKDFAVAVMSTLILILKEMSRK